MTYMDDDHCTYIFEIQVDGDTVEWVSAENSRAATDYSTVFTEDVGGLEDDAEIGVLMCTEKKARLARFMGQDWEYEDDDDEYPPKHSMWSEWKRDPSPRHIAITSEWI